MISLKRIYLGFLAIAIFVSSEAAASNDVEAVGMVTIDKTCGKTSINQLRVVVLEETPLGNSHPRLVRLDDKGTFSLLVSKSYKYTFQVKPNANLSLHLGGKATFDPSYPENKPVLVATCRQEVEKKT